MKLRGGKPKAPVGRQRRQSDWRGPSAFSYHAQRAERPEAPGRQTRSLAQQRNRVLSAEFWFKRSGLLIALVAGLICLISVLSLSNQPRIVLLNSQTSQYAFHDTSIYQSAAHRYLSSSIWNKNKITVNTGAVSAKLKQQFPELSSVTVTLPLVGHRPIFYLQPNPPSFVLQTVNGTYVLDSKGTALIAKDAAPAQTVARLPVITDQTGARVELGKQIISAAEADFIQTIIRTLSAKQTSVTSIVLPMGGVQQLDIRVEGQPYVVKFNMHDVSTARQQVGTYLATVANLAGQKTVPSQYIDVRVIGRAYYQ